MDRCNTNALGIAIGAVCALGMLVLSVVGLAGYGQEAVSAMQAWHIWYDLSVVGIIAGIIEAGIVGYIGGFLIAWFYNLVA
jgi:hypothetical protein